ncbi:MAG: CapA family protein [Halobacteriovoraceae bacterium]|nr:CapA family protein [Halobacteriovoraceae bacterium]
MKPLLLSYLLMISIYAPAQGITFEKACDVGRTYTLSFVGDILLHSPLQKKAYSSSQGYHSLWSSIEPIFQSVDVSYANLEGPIADGVNKYGQSVSDPGLRYDANVYSSYPMFNYHPSLAQDLVDSGIDFVSTANNHSLDRRSLGVDRTIENLEDSNLSFIGTRKVSNEPWSSQDIYTITQYQDLSIAWIACTYGTNGITDNKNQVLNCFDSEDQSLILKTLSSIRMEKLADLIIITPHWGYEYSHSPAKEVKSLAKKFAEAGADLIIGSHPHVLQPMEYYKTSNGREAFIAYSLGNFVSNQAQLARRSSMVLLVGVTKKGQRQENETIINGVGFVPTLMRNNSSQSVLHLESIEKDDPITEKQSALEAMLKYLPEENLIYASDEYTDTRGRLLPESHCNP